MDCFKERHPNLIKVIGGALNAAVFFEERKIGYLSVPAFLPSLPARFEILH